MNQSIAILINVLMKSLHLAASEPPTSNICEWNDVRCASGSSTPVKVTLGPVNVLGIAVSRIACENGVVNSLGGDAASGSSPPRHPRRNSSLVRWSSSSCLRGYKIRSHALLLHFQGRHCILQPLHHAHKLLHGHFFTPSACWSRGHGFLEIFLTCLSIKNWN